MIGAGSMGGGLALLMAEKGLSVSIQDPSEATVDALLKSAEDQGIRDKLTKHESYEERTIYFGGNYDSYYISGGSGGTDMSKLLAANRAFDEETRQRARDDTELDTGNPLVGGTWRTATRGEKLRTCVYHTGRYETGKKDCEEVLNVLIKILGNDCKNEDGNVVKRESVVAGFEMMTRRKAFYEEHLMLIPQLEALVLKETEEGWNWEKGIKEQYEMREKQQAVGEKMNAERDRYNARWE